MNQAIVDFGLPEATKEATEAPEAPHDGLRQLDLKVRIPAAAQAEASDEKREREEKCERDDKASLGTTWRQCR